ncbi:Shikimate dehydrogenase [Jaminaea rosea]|uniref:Pentafunctional AROM polypeptide n=1 Tax=Jaminaea rosea TaxID=1569628 RepID=A0A316UZF7_9BASI|nr:Shikimate dehydrogenase [Jaminaea rosea]PWN28555.1 Shikimate dehydrogenase [Jaminaea rosea]
MAADARVTGQKEASYHLPPVDSVIPAGQNFTIHHLRCLDVKIHLGFYLFPHIFHTLFTTLKSSTYVLIQDRNVAGIYGQALQQAWETATQGMEKQPRLLTYTLPPGEMTKSRQVKEEIEDWMLEQGCVRDTVLIAFGGGVIGDLSGFVAATFMRGIKYVQVPTTLLAMVDSAVGGKTAIDTPHGKNLVGAFYQPQYIFIDAGLLRTLPEREFSNGMAEVVKTAAIWDAADFAKLESEYAAIRSAVLDREAQQSATQGRHSSDRTIAQDLLLDVIRGSVGVKSHIVTIDEKETGLRNLVNFGHSIGHAIEAVLTPEILHGECISIGMILEAELSRRLSSFAQVNIGRLTKVLKAYNLPVSVTDPRIASLDKARELTTQRILQIMRVDKKNVGDTKKIVLLAEIGRCHEEKATAVHDDVIRRVLAPQVRVMPVIQEAAASSTPARLSTPGSKSISNRALVLAALAKGTTKLRNLLHSDDTAVMMTGLGQLKAAEFQWEEGGEVVVVNGRGGALVTPPTGTEIYLQNAGTAARFMATVVALAKDAEGKGRPTVITGNARMKQRPIAPLVEALRSNGVQIQHPEQDGFLPLAVSGEQGFRGGRIELAASISSQYVSSILLCAPLAKDEDVVLELVGGKVISQPYIDMTIAMMRDFGAKVERLADPSTGQPTDTYRIARGGYTSPGAYDVESDASSATYPLALAAITGSGVVVEKIGSSSLQGDARFATDVLAPMGCKVTQTPTETQVLGPSGGALHQFESGDVDMEPMTDAFLTAAVLLAVAGPNPESGAKSTRIRGIANQRVKECNRIQAMMDQLAKFGVKTVEHEDGLEVFGMDRSQLKTGVSVHCYDDHRVAMAFSILAAVVPGREGTVLEEKRCVEKTWPNWWDDLETKLAGAVQGVDGDLLDHHAAATSSTAASSSLLTTPLSKLDNSQTPRVYPNDATIFIIGMRGSGKTHLGQVAARALSRTFLDADVLFEEKHGVLGEFVKAHGWPGFRKAEAELLADLIRSRGTGCVISLGGGVVEGEANRALLKAYANKQGPVVHTVRDLAEIAAFLSTSDRPAWGEPMEDVWQRRKPWFAECSSHELVNLASVSGLANKANGATPNENAGALDASSSAAISIAPARNQEAQVSAFFRFISGQDTNHVDIAAQSIDGQVRPSYLLTLTFPDLIPALPLLDEISTGSDALELRVDLLSPTGAAPKEPAVPPKEYVALQLTALRQRTSLPIVFTVRTKSQGGLFPDNAQDEYFSLVQLALRMGVEYLDVEIQWPTVALEALRAQKGRTQILASYHDWTGKLNWASTDTWSHYERAVKYGDVPKLVGKANTMQDNWDLETFRLKAAKAHPSKPLLAINMGSLGQASRILNTTLSLVTHEAMPFPGAPGQMSVAQVQRARHLLGLMPQKRFFLFGSPIAHSLSPCLHNTAHQALGHPHVYERFEATEVTQQLKELIRSNGFGGASVTIPLKVAIMAEMDELTPVATIIGAVNTVIPVRDQSGKLRLIGDNTDWMAIHSLCKQHLPGATTSNAAPLTSLVIGAGGSARAALYAAYRLGSQRIFLYNRTLSKAQELAQSLPKEWNIVVLDSLDAAELVEAKPRAIISNVPADGTSLSATSGAGVILPSTLLQGRGGVAVDMSYKPHKTPLLELVDKTNNEAATATLSASDAGSTGRWTAVPGLTILLEQGCQQFKLWTGREAPRALVERECWAEYVK